MKRDGRVLCLGKGFTWKPWLGFLSEFLLYNQVPPVLTQGRRWVHTIHSKPRPLKNHEEDSGSVHENSSHKDLFDGKIRQEIVFSTKDAVLIGPLPYFELHLCANFLPVDRSSWSLL